MNTLQCRVRQHRNDDNWIGGYSLRAGIILKLSIYVNYFRVYFCHEQRCETCVLAQAHNAIALHVAIKKTPSFDEVFLQITALK